ncbi:MAG: hypothetical protein ACLUD2_20745 [Clostridium sp.]
MIRGSRPRSGVTMGARGDHALARIPGMEFADDGNADTETSPAGRSRTQAVCFMEPCPRNACMPGRGAVLFSGTSPE